MYSNNLKKLMIGGIAYGLLISHGSILSKEETGKDEGDSDLLELISKTKGNITFKPFTEDDLLLQLNEEGAQIYNSLSAEGKAMALRVSSRSCNGENECKGLNACASSKNKCAGLGSCKGSTKCSFSDKNLAVKVVARKMAEKRLEASQTEKKKIT